MKALWTEETSSFDGDLFFPKPLPHVPQAGASPPSPIRVGGGANAALRRAARIGQGWFTFNRLPEDFPAALERLDYELAEVGRTRSDEDFTVSACPTSTR